MASLAHLRQGQQPVRGVSAMRSNFGSRGCTNGMPGGQSSSDLCWKQSAPGKFGRVARKRPLQCLSQHVVFSSTSTERAQGCAPTKRPAMAQGSASLVRRRTSLRYDTPLHGIMRRYRSYFTQWRALVLLARCNTGIGCLEMTAGTFRMIVLSYLVPPGVCFQKSRSLSPGWRPSPPRCLKKRLRRDASVSD